MDDNRSLFEDYLQQLAKVAAQGDAREESFYFALQAMLEAFAQTIHRDVVVTALPRPTDAGNPDFRVWDGSQHIIGYIEAKRPTEEHLDKIENSGQLERYRATFPNLILTNFLEFRLYRDGKKVETALLARPAVLNTLRIAPPTENPASLYALLERFFSFVTPKVYSAASLAAELAKRTRFLRTVAEEQLKREEAAPGELYSFYEAFKTFLIADLTPEAFADLFAQTITYGLFAARTRTTDNFQRRSAAEHIPHTVGVLRKLFQFISSADPPTELIWCVDDIVEVLSVADVNEILDRYYQEGKGSDPIIHFYETFLSEYDPQERERRGVYYTPEPVVSYIVRSLHGLLKDRLQEPEGLASNNITLLDPAAGTMTFVAQATQQAVSEFQERYGAGALTDFIRNHILKNFFAFELMMAPYAVGHLKMNFLLKELGYILSNDERVRFYLTNALDIEELEISRLPFFSALAAESQQALEIKKQTPILVILGNPPYSGESTNQGAWIRSLIEAYKQVDGRPLGEKNPKWLQDDYVKFLRFAQWKIEQAGCGVVGMISNHAYLDNPTFRGMRQSLLRTYDEIYILNLHGNTRKRETCPDGSPDQNVFDIQQGVAIALFVKQHRQTDHEEGKAEAKIYYADLWGSRESKYAWLSSNHLNSTPWQPLQPSPPLYFFVPRNNDLEAIYQRYPSLPEIFPVYSVGIVTARDRLTIHRTREEVWNTVTNFVRLEPELARQAYRLGKDARDWKVEWAQKDLSDSGPSKQHIVPILYRPFDVRYTYYTGHSRGFHCMPRYDVMRHMLLGSNLGLITHKQEGLNLPWSHSLVTQLIVEHVALSTLTTNYLFPLYLYHNGEQTHLFDQHNDLQRTPNLNATLTTTLTQAYGQSPLPEEIFHYTYAVLYAPTYRERYYAFLQSDFPRVPFPTRSDLFSRYADLGARLVQIHLLRSTELNPPLCKYHGEGNHLVQQTGATGLRYDPVEQRAYINAHQYFAPIPQKVWEYPIGGYQVCEKWLKERQGHRLSLDEIQTFCRIVTALDRTIGLQQEIDALYEEIETCHIEPIKAGGTP
jgi:hypothetical protein